MVLSDEAREQRHRVLLYMGAQKKSMPAMVLEAIRAIGDDESGASLPVIRKWILANYSTDDEALNTRIKKAVKKYLDKGVIVRAKCSKKAVGVAGSFVVSKTDRPKGKSLARHKLTSNARNRKSEVANSEGDSISPSGTSEASSELF